MRGGAVHLDVRIEPGDMMIQVNYINLLSVETHTKSEKGF